MLLVKKTALATALLCAAASTVTATPLHNNVFLTPVMPRITVTGLEGNTTIGSADAMVPLLGNSNGFVFGDVQGKTGRDNAWFVGAGAGFRQILNACNIIGAYTFIDRDTTANKNQFWILNPGIESLGERWDFRVNGYIPVSSKQKYEYSLFASQIGLTQYVTFRGHQQFDRLFDFYEETGPGADAEIGRIFPALHRLALYGGGYFYHLQNTSNIRGVEGRIEYPVTRFLTALVADTYDNHARNTIGAGLRLFLGYLPPACAAFDIHDRLLDPIQRNLGTLNTGSGTPTENIRKIGSTGPNGKTDGEQVARDNIWFFTPDGSANFTVGIDAQSCTYEHPCMGSEFTQANVNTIDTITKNASFYFKPGAYPINDRIALNNGQSTWGRTADYAQSAAGNNRAAFQGGFDLTGNNTLDSIQLFNNNGTQTKAIGIQNAQNILLNNDNIGANNTNQGYVLGLDMKDSQVKATNSTLYAYTNSSTNTAQAINGDHCDLNIVNSQVSSLAAVNGSDDFLTANASGINMLNNSNLTISNSAISTSATANDSQTFSLAGSTVNNITVIGGTLNISNSSINTNGQAQAVYASAIISGINTDNNAQVTIDQTTFNNTAQVTSEQSSFINSFAINLRGGSSADISNSNFNMNSNGVSTAPNPGFGVGMNTIAILGFDSAFTSSNNNTFTGFTQTTTAQPTDSAYSTSLAYNLSNCTANINNNVIDLTDNANDPSSYGIYIENGTADIENTSIKLNTIGGQPTANARGLFAITSQVTLKDSVIDLEGSSDTALNLTDINTFNTTLNVQNTSLTARAINANFAPNVFGIDARNNSTVTVQNSSFDITANSNLNNATAIGIRSQQSNINADHNTFNITSTAPNGKATSWGIFDMGGSTINQSNNQFTIVHTGQTTAGGNVGP